MPLFSFFRIGSLLLDRSPSIARCSMVCNTRSNLEDVLLQFGVERKLSRRGFSIRLLAYMSMSTTVLTQVAGLVTALCGVSGLPDKTSLVSSFNESADNLCSRNPYSLDPQHFQQLRRQRRVNMCRRQMHQSIDHLPA